MYFEKFRLFFLSRLKVAFPSTTIRLDIAFTKVSTVEIVSAKPSTITKKDRNFVCSFKSNVKNPRSGRIVGSNEKATIPVKPIKKNTGTIIKNEITKLFCCIHSLPITLME